MPRYRLRLHDGPTTPPITEVMALESDADANDLAQITLLLTRT